MRGTVIQSRSFPVWLLAAALAAVWGPYVCEERAEPLVVVQETPSLLTQHCGECHQDGSAKGGLDLDGPLARRDWENVRGQLRLQLMPPPADAQLSPEARAELVAWVENEHLAPFSQPPRSSSAKLRRLNREEYNRSLQQLLGISQRPADQFPEEETAVGFDNIAEAQHLPPALAEGYLQVAQQVLGAVFDPILPKTQSILVDPSQFPKAPLTYDNFLILKSPAAERLAVQTAHGGEGTAAYRLQITAYARAAGNESPRLQINGMEFPLQGSRFQPDMIDAEISLPEGASEIVLGLANPFEAPSNPDPHQRFRQAIFLKAELTGPLKLHGQPNPLSTRWTGGLAPEQPAKLFLAPVQAVVGKFAEQATRRPLDPYFVEKLGRLCEQCGQDGLSVRETLQLGFTAVLVSPAFLFFQEPPTVPELAGPQLLDEPALAVRLAYFLWKSPPDEALRKLAAAGKLRENLAVTLDRMLQDPRSVSLARDFAGQWLQLRNVTLSRPDPTLFPEGTPALLADFTEELVLFVHDLIRRRQPVRDFLLAEETFTNAALRQHYGLAQTDNETALVPTSLKGTFRKGLLGKAGILTLTSQSTRTSPVARGKWILECLLGLAPPPPPPNVPTLTSPEGHLVLQTQRDQLERHRSQPACANCHACLDPFGFALEKYDALGRWRLVDGDQRLDIAVKLPGGQQIRGASELSDALAAHHLDDFRLHLATSLLAYGTGQPVDTRDIRQVREVLRIAQIQGDHFGGYVTGVVRSVLFQTKSYF